MKSGRYGLPIQLRLRRGPVPSMRWVCASLVLLIGLLGTLANTARAQSVADIDISGSKKLGENVVGEWHASLTETPVVTSAAGYQPVAYLPTGPAVPVAWELPVEYRWNFGDGTGTHSTGERTGIAHTYTDDGEYTLVVEAHTQDGLIGRGTRSVVVHNRRPFDIQAGAVRVAPDSDRFLLTAAADDAAGDTLRWTWSLGGGRVLSSEEGRIEHEFRPGDHTIAVTADDGEGGVHEKSFTLHVAQREPATEPEAPEETFREPIPESPSRHIQLRVRGAVSTALDAEVLPFTGIHLAGLDSAGACRFMFTAWDPGNLVSVFVILDMADLPEEGGRFRARLPEVRVHFHANADRYRHGFKTNTKRPPTGDVASRSPYGLSAGEGFETEGGHIDYEFIPGVRATGEVNVSLVNSDDDSPLRNLSLKGGFNLDLQALDAQGYMDHDACGPAAPEIESTAPLDGTQHVYNRQPNVQVTFTRALDPSTLTADTIQLTWPDREGFPVPVAARLLRSPREVVLKPEAPLLGGVTYTAWVRTGEDGVRGENGLPLEDSDGSGWHRWSFTTRLALEMGTPAGSGNLSCHVFQTVRDAPLLPGKPAVARIYADWKPHPRVHPDAQVRSFEAQAVLLQGQNEVASTSMQFIRDDLLNGSGVDQRQAEHTANIFWTPRPDGPSFLRVGLRVPGEPGELPKLRYFTRCPTQTWAHSPSLDVVFYLFAINAWADDEVRQPLSETAVRIARDAGEVARRMYPFVEVNMRFGGIVRPPLKERLNGDSETCSDGCLSNLVLHQSTVEPGADLYVGFAPMGGPLGGVSGRAAQEIGSGEPGIIWMSVDGTPEHYSRFVQGTVHEMGHALWLEHVPFGDGVSRGAVVGLREEAFANARRPVHWYQGIEGFLIDASGRRGWNKSSTEGNAQSDWLVPLMYPGTMHLKDSYISRHQYLCMLEELDQRGGQPRGRGGTDRECY